MSFIAISLSMCMYILSKHIWFLRAQVLFHDSFTLFLFIHIKLKNLIVSWSLSIKCYLSHTLTVMIRNQTKKNSQQNSLLRHIKKERNYIARLRRALHWVPLNRYSSCRVATYAGSRINLCSYLSRLFTLQCANCRSSIII